eukprot:RCo044317
MRPPSTDASNVVTSPLSAPRLHNITFPSTCTHHLNLLHSARFPPRRFIMGWLLHKCLMLIRGLGRALASLPSCAFSVLSLSPSFFISATQATDCCWPADALPSVWPPVMLYDLGGPRLSRRKERPGWSSGEATRVGSEREVFLRSSVQSGGHCAQERRNGGVGEGTRVSPACAIAGRQKERDGGSTLAGE